MFTLGGRDYPTSEEELKSGLRAGLEEYFRLPAGGQVLQVQSTSFPVLELLKIDLSGAEVLNAEAPRLSTGAGPIEPGLKIGHFEAVAHPLLRGAGEVQLDLRADEVALDFDRDLQSRPMLVLTSAKNGHVDCSVSRSSLNNILMDVARTAAAPHGVDVQSVEVQLTPTGSRSLRMEARVKAGKLFFTATVVVKGALDIDDALNARFSGLTCSGDGMLGTLACSAIEPQLRKLEARPLPLSAFALQEIRLHDLQIHVEDDLRVTASFGSSPG